MEDKTQISNSGAPEKADKTIVMSSGTPVDNSKSEEKNEAKPENGGGNSSAKQSESKTTEQFMAQSKAKSSVVPVVAAAGAAAAVSGIAGVALGATFSDEIKEVIAQPFFADETPSTSENIPTAASVASTESEEVDLDSSVEKSDLEGFSSLEISGMDQEGNVYSVSFLDFEGDGEIDSQTLEFQSVDGVTITYTEFGNSIDPTFIEDILLADNSDYVECGYCDALGVSMMDSYLYQIQPGDTLSEIAAANNTSIEHLMELNPQISNPDLIYAGHNLIIPEGDQIYDPYQTTEQSMDTSFIAEESYFVEDSPEPTTENYDAIDWESFYDSPVDNPYSSELETIDFEAMETPQSYSETDYGMGDFGIDESGLGFI